MQTSLVTAIDWKLSIALAKVRQIWADWVSVTVIIHRVHQIVSILRWRRVHIGFPVHQAAFDLLQDLGVHTSQQLPCLIAAAETGNKRLLDISSHLPDALFLCLEGSVSPPFE